MIRHHTEKRPRKRASTIRQRVKIVGLGLAAALLLGLPAHADQRYAVSGNDRYQIGQSELQTSIVYSGTQQLTVVKDGAQKRFTAKAAYTRSDAAGTVPAQASFEQIMTPQGELKDRMDLDPDYLTVLNQPFAVELDPTTLRELLHLRGKLPFTFPAPMTGGTLQGYLERGSIGRISGHPSLAVDFDASGPMAGPLPDRAQMSIVGTMRMQGTAYYSLRGDTLLLALNETLTISGTLHDRSQSSPVKIVYQRWIKADDTQSSETAASSH